MQQRAAPRRNVPLRRRRCVDGCHLGGPGSAGRPSQPHARSPCACAPVVPTKSITHTTATAAFTRACIMGAGLAERRSRGEDDEKSRAGGRREHTGAVWCRCGIKWIVLMSDTRQEPLGCGGGAPETAKRLMHYRYRLVTSLRFVPLLKCLASARLCPAAMRVSVGA